MDLKKITVILVTLMLCIQKSYLARILGIAGYPSYSHQIAYRPLWKQLSLRGHQVVVLTPNPMNDSTLTNLTEIDLSIAYRLYEDKYNGPKLITENHDKFFTLAYAFQKMLYDIYDQELAQPAVQTLIQNKSEHFDLVIVEDVYPALFGFSERFSCPHIGIISTDAAYYVHRAVGNPNHPVQNPNHVLPFDGERGFFERFATTLFYVAAEYFTSYFDDADQLMKKYFGSDIRSVYEIMNNMSMLFVNVNPVTYDIRPVSPATVFIGGGIHIQKPKPLPKDLQLYLDNATEGVIYFSLGSNVKSIYISNDTLNVILNTFEMLPYQILWKYEDEDLPRKMSNVKIAKWVPQQDVLRHPNVKLFITQGGLQSVEEGIYSHVPMVAIPFYSDQHLNARRLVLKGIGQYVNSKIMDENSLKKIIVEVIENPQYRSNIVKLARLSLDQPMSGLEKAVWWTEYTLRNRGTNRLLKTDMVGMPLYKYVLLDVIFCYTLLTIIFLYTCFCLCKKVLKLFL
ncbi:UDP-glucuronosyltransferase [Rhyzopertha dominica]|nr:UDP-glucuronosyltransferase [Rhyzopertha dominica]